MHVTMAPRPRARRLSLSLGALSSDRHRALACRTDVAVAWAEGWSDEQSVAHMFAHADISTAAKVRTCCLQTAAAVRDYTCFATVPSRRRVLSHTPQILELQLLEKLHDPAHQWHALSVVETHIEQNLLISVGLPEARTQKIDDFREGWHLRCNQIKRLPEQPRVVRPDDGIVRVPDAIRSEAVREISSELGSQLA